MLVVKRVQGKRGFQFYQAKKKGRCCKWGRKGTGIWQKKLKFARGIPARTGQSTINDLPKREGRGEEKRGRDSCDGMKKSACQRLSTGLGLLKIADWYLGGLEF